MTSQYTPQDYELLSAYLDQEISTAERERLETRLAADADLRKNLEGLRQTRQMLRSLPILRAPRSFAVTPEMAGLHRQPARWFTTLRFSSAFAGLLLILVMIGDVFSGVTPLPGIARQAAPESAPAVMMAEPAAGVEEQPAEAEALPEVAKTAAGTETSDMAATESSTTPAPGAALMALPTATPGIERQAPSVGAAGENGAADLTAPPAYDSPLPEAALEQAAPEEPIPTESLAGQDEVQEESLRVANQNRRVLFRTAEVALLVIAVGAALAAWYLRRQGV